jgi:solute carrier family 35, member C2
MAASLFVAAVSFEGLNNILSSPFFHTFQSTLEIITIILFGGCLAFLMLIAEFLLISDTSVVTFSVAGIFKEILTIVLSAVLFGDTFTSLNIIGLCISLAGLAMYNYMRVKKMIADKIPSDEYFRIETLNSPFAEDVFGSEDSIL